MPRIPVRTEPYTSPSRQHRHYKNKRDQVLRSLGKAAYINGSHFAIMWVSARGDVDTYASEALKNRLDDWFIKGGVADEAKEMVRAYRNSASAPQIPFASLDYEDDFDDEEAELQRDRFPTDDEAAKDSSLTKQRSVSVTHQSANSTPLLGLDADVFTDENSGERTVDQSGSKAMHNRPKLERSASTSLHHRGNLFRARRPIAPLDTNIANEQQSFARTLSSGVPHTSASGFLPLRSPFRLEGIDSDFSVGPYSAPLRSDLAMPHGMMSVHPAPPSLVKTTLKSAAARTAFLELRFSQLQQGMCKTVAKAWIKVIEPKKQTRCPYNKGDEGKPDWWPEGVRHKEPDHLMKPERHALLLTILRSPRVKVARLQLATAEVVALIKADKVSLLDDVYRIAREEEKMREARMDQETQITVDVSTLEGWSEDEQSIVASERAQSPSASGIDGEEEGMILDSVPRQNSRKRAGGANILQLPSAATNSVRNNKRRLSGSPIINQDADLADAKVEARPPGLGLGLNVTGMPLTSFTSDTAPRKSVKQSGLGISVGRRTNANAQTWLLHEATQHGVQRTSVSSHPMASTSSLSGSSDSRQAAHSESIRHQYGQFGSHLGGLLQEQYGLITPLTGNTQLMDPSFLTAAKDDRYVTGASAFPLDFQGSSEPRLLDNGYMSAPMSHAHLFPHAAPSFVSDVQHQAASQQSYEHHTHQFSDGAPKSPHLDSFNTLASSATHAIPQQSHVPQNNNTLFASSQEQQSDAQLASGTTTGETGGALGLHGVEGAQWSSSSAVGFGAIQFNHGDDHESWWSGGAIQRAGPALPDHSDASFDASFASTIDSGGPATPPQQSSSALARDTHFAGTSSASGSRANGKFVGAPTPMSKGRSPANLIWSNYGPPQYTENARQNTLAKHSDTSSRSLGAPELASEKETRRYAHPSFAQLAEQQKKQVEVDKQQSDLPIRQNGGATTSSFDNWLYPSQSH